MSQRRRFDVFKRDQFICAYCGRKPPQVTLQVDHVVPVCEGGTDEIDNLVTACFDCNSGKAGILLAVKPEAVKARRSLLIEREEQERAYIEFIREKRQRDDERLLELGELVFGEGWVIADKNLGVARYFLLKIPYDELLDAAQLANSMTARRGDPWRYFCGICWRKIKGDDRGGRYQDRPE